MTKQNKIDESFEAYFRQALLKSRNETYSGAAVSFTMFRIIGTHVACMVHSAPD